MKNETLKYPFSEKIMFASEEEAGICYLSYKMMILNIGGKIQKFTHSACFQEGYVLNSEKVLLVEKQLMGQIPDIFSFKLIVFNLNTKKLEIIKTFQFSDYRGLKIKKDRIVLGLNKYDSSLLSSPDPDGFQYDPPCSECARYAEVVSLNFDLIELDSKVYDDYMPDDLILHFGGIGHNEIILFNNSILIGLDQVVCKIDDFSYAVRDRKCFLRINKNGICNDIHRTDQNIVGIGLSIQNSLPVFHLYQNDKVEVLSPENSLQFILS